MDPEALLVLSIHVARDDPRLFDELLDWVVLNGRLLSVQRLRNLAALSPEPRLVEATLAWAARNKSTLRYAPSRASVEELSVPHDVFLHQGRVSRHDATFERYGYIRPPVTLSRKSTTPNLELPAAFGLRLRQLLGVSARAEVLRCLITADAANVGTAFLTEATAYTRRNVSDALGGLVASGVVTVREIGSERHYGVDVPAWAALLRMPPDRRPVFVEWPQLLRIAAWLLTWLREAHWDELSDYMRGSESRQRLDSLGQDLSTVGMSVPNRGRPEEYWDALIDLGHQVMQHLSPPVR
jgi:hypothetical protein